MTKKQQLEETLEQIKQTAQQMNDLVKRFDRIYLSLDEDSDYAKPLIEFEDCPLNRGDYHTLAKKLGHLDENEIPVFTVKDLIRTSLKDIMFIRGFGVTKCSKISNWMKNHEISFLSK